jgi:hypothetical protein
LRPLKRRRHLQRLLVPYKTEFKLTVFGWERRLDNGLRRGAGLLERITFESEEDKTRLELEAAQVKTMYRQAVTANDDDTGLLKRRLSEVQQTMVETAGDLPRARCPRCPRARCPMPGFRCPVPCALSLVSRAMVSIMRDMLLHPAPPHPASYASRLI